MSTNSPFFLLDRPAIPRPAGSPPVKMLLRMGLILSSVVEPPLVSTILRTSSISVGVGIGAGPVTPADLRGLLTDSPDGMNDGRGVTGGIAGAEVGGTTGLRPDRGETADSGLEAGVTPPAVKRVGWTTRGPIRGADGAGCVKVAIDGILTSDSGVVGGMVIPAAGTMG